MSDEKIIKVAEKTGLPVFQKRVFENELEDYNYIVIRNGTFKKQSCNSYTRTIYIVYVFDGEQRISDKDFIQPFEELGLIFEEMKPDDFQIANTNKWIDMNTYIFKRPER